MKLFLKQKISLIFVMLGFSLFGQVFGSGYYIPPPKVKFDRTKCKEGEKVLECRKRLIKESLKEKSKGDEDK